MYKCICGYKTHSKMSMKSHLRGCSMAIRKYKMSSSHIGDDLIDSLEDAVIGAAVGSILGDIFSSDDNGFSGGGGDFGGGGSSGSWDD